MQLLLHQAYSPRDELAIHTCAIKPSTASSSSPSPKTSTFPMTDTDTDSSEQSAPDITNYHEERAHTQSVLDAYYETMEKCMRRIYNLFAQLEDDEKAMKPGDAEEKERITKLKEQVDRELHVLKQKQREHMAKAKAFRDDREYGGHVEDRHLLEELEDWADAEDVEVEKLGRMGEAMKEGGGEEVEKDAKK